MKYIKPVDEIPAADFLQKRIYREILNEFLNSGYEYARVVDAGQIRAWSLVAMINYYYKDQIIVHNRGGEVYLERK